MLHGWHPWKGPARRTFRKCFWTEENHQLGTLTWLIGSASPFGLAGKVYLHSGHHWTCIGLFLDVNQTMAISIIRVHLATIWPYHNLVYSRSLSAKPIVNRFLKASVRSHVQDLIPPLDLNLVMVKIDGTTLWTLATCSLLHLSMKIAFLVAIQLPQPERWAIWEL